jgi:hypothetical protein
MVVEAMKKELYTEIEINASPEDVWAVLTDFSKFPEWNPFMRRASGEVKQGERIEVYLQPPDGTGMAFKPTLTRVEANRELRWLGHTFVPGVFDGEHIFIIEALEGTGVRFVQREKFTGMLASKSKIRKPIIIPLGIALVLQRFHRKGAKSSQKQR